ncbi:MAG: FtsX-like permease family protein [Corynebacterium sp.]|nr:FtsX-like permease family protein [Corynebacterium sp.]
MMRTISLRNIAAHKLRLALSIFAVVLGTAFIAGSAMFTNVLSTTYDKAASNQFQNINLVATGKSGSGLLSLIGGGSGIGKISQSTVQELRQNPDVKSVVAANDSASIILAGSDGKAISGGSVGTAYVEGHPSISQAPLSEGSWPTEAGTVAIDATTAKNGNLTIGSTTTMVHSGGRSQVTVVGIFNAKKANINGVAVVVPESDYFSEFATGGVATALISFKDGVSQDEGTAALTKAFPTLNFTSAEEIVKQTSQALGQYLKYMKYMLWAFAGIGLLVGTFIISNTFSMIVAQRNREFALLRSIGITSQQVTRSVLFEALIIGLIGSIIGIVVGFGLSQGILAFLASKGTEINGGIGLDATSILVPIIVGVIITAVSAYAPARAAGRVRPVEAMHQNDAKGIKLRSWFGFPVLILGVILAVSGAMSKGSSMNLIFSLIGIGAVLIVIGYWLASPAIAIPIASGIGRIIGLPFKTVGKLAATNSRRNPRRTAATAFALTLGVMLVSGVGMLGNTMSRTLTEELKSTIKADFMLSSADSSFSIPTSVPDDLKTVDGVESVTSAGLAEVTVNGKALYASTRSIVADGDLSKTNDVDVVSGDTSANGVVITQNFATSENLQLGSTVRVASSTAVVDEPVVAVVKGDMSSGIGDGWVTRSVVDQLGDSANYRLMSVYVVAKPGSNLATVKKNVENAVADYLVVDVQSKNELTSSVGQIFNTMLGIVYALLGLSLIIAVLGIINTLALSVVERTREIGMLRAVGMQRRQVRFTIYLESIVIALFGSIIGAAIGLGLGWCAIHTTDGALNPYVPWDQVIYMIIGSAIVGIIAAVLPAIKAARTNPLEAIKE